MVHQFLTLFPVYCIERYLVITKSVPKSKVQKKITKLEQSKHGPLQKLEVGSDHGRLSILC